MNVPTQEQYNELLTKYFDLLLKDESTEEDGIKIDKMSMVLLHYMNRAMRHELPNGVKS